MSGAVPQPPARDASASSLASALQAIVRHRGVQTAVALWVCGTILALWLAHGSLPFDRPAVAKLPVAMQVVGPSVALIEVSVLMLVAFFVTRGRVIPDMAARAPARWLALRETVLVLGYAALGQVGGWLVGPWLGYRPFSFHLAGSMFGGTMTTRPGGRVDLVVLQLRRVRVGAVHLFSATILEHRSQPALKRSPQGRPANTHGLGDRIRR